jgi:hypothetical protein
MKKLFLFKLSILLLISNSIVLGATLDLPLSAHNSDADAASSSGRLSMTSTPRGSTYAPKPLQTLTTQKALQDEYKALYSAFLALGKQVSQTNGQMREFFATQLLHLQKVDDLTFDRGASSRAQLEKAISDLVILYEGLRTETEKLRAENTQLKLDIASTTRELAAIKSQQEQKNRETDRLLHSKKDNDACPCSLM